MRKRPGGTSSTRWLIPRTECSAVRASVDGDPAPRGACRWAYRAWHQPTSERLGRNVAPGTDAATVRSVARGLPRARGMQVGGEHLAVAAVAERGVEDPAGLAGQALDGPRVA